MNNFLIGHFDSYNEYKQNRDFRDDFYGVEVCLIKNIEDINTIKTLSEDRHFNIGIHFPLRANQWTHRDPQYLSKNYNTRLSSLQYMNSEIEFASSINPKYILLHYPKPVILDDSVNWMNWKFADDTEYYFESVYDENIFKEKSEEFFRWFSAKGSLYDFIPIIELDALNKYLYDTDFLEKMLDTYSNIRICLDTARLHQQDTLDPNFDGVGIASRFAKYTSLIHVANVQVKDKILNGHYPVLPELKIEDGWADIEAYLKAITNNNKDVRILFEHRSDLINDEQLESCYSWVKSIVNTK